MKNCQQLSGCLSLVPAVRGQGGSVLIFLIVLMVIFAILGVGMLSMFGSSLLSAFSPNSARRANYLAESGLRYTVSEVRPATTQEATLTSIDDGSVAGKWFTVTPGVARFQVRVYPYWSKPDVATATTFINNAPVANSGFPPDLPGMPGTGYAIPGTGASGVACLKVGTNYRIGINSVVITADRKNVTYNLISNVKCGSFGSPPSPTSNVTVQTGDYANLAFPTTTASQTVTKGSVATPLILNINAVTAIPEKNGEFYTDGGVCASTCRYQTARVVGTNVQLEGINWSAADPTVTFPASTYLTFLQAARLDATGEHQQTQRNRTDYLTIPLPGGGVGSEPGTSTAGPPTNQDPPALTDAGSGFTSDLSALNLALSGDRVVSQGYIATGGTHAYWAAFGHLGEAGYSFPDPEQTTCDIGYHAAPISTTISDNLRSMWMQYRHLNYDVQIKMGWDLNLNYANQGVTFRWHENPTCAAAVAAVGGCPSTDPYCCYEGYGLSFMRFNGKTTCSGDMIPNTIKPGAGNAEGGKLLLVLWQQKINAANVAAKDWLAYAQLGDPTNYQNPATERSPADPDQKVTGNQGWPDGRLNDNASIVLRVEDATKTTGGVTTRYNYIKLFYGDASPNTFANDSRTLDAVATNKERARYYPKWRETDQPGGTEPLINPKWPSNQFGLNGATTKAYWYNNLTTYDYYTLASIAPTAPYNTVTLVYNSSPRTGFATWAPLTDGCTIRTTDFTLDAYPEGRKEIGLFAMGDLNAGAGTTVAFDDFYIQVLGGY